MPAEGRARSALSAPWLVTIIAAVVAVALAVVLFGFARPASHKHDRSNVVAFTRDEQDAMSAASIEVVNLLTYSRKTFDADFQRALSGATGSLKSDLSGQQATTLKTMTDKKIDLKATVSDTALETTTSTNIAVLVVVSGFTVDDKGTVSPTGVQRLEVTMTKSGSKWLASDLNSIGIS